MILARLHESLRNLSQLVNYYVIFWIYFCKLSKHQLLKSDDRPKLGIYIHVFVIYVFSDKKVQQISIFLMVSPLLLAVVNLEPHLVVFAIEVATDYKYKTQ